jgi:DNA invertase Pin-like site-specific DNA recombinase
MKQRREINRWLKSRRIKSKSVRWYIDKSTNENLEQPQLSRLQEDTLQGNVRAVVVWRLDRIAPSLRDGLETLRDWCERSLRVVSVSQAIDLQSAKAKQMATVLAAVAEMALETRRERTKAGLASAHARGRFGGRPRVDAEEAKVKLVKKLQKGGRLSVQEICNKAEISRSTYYRYLAL